MRGSTRKQDGRRQVPTTPGVAGRAARAGLQAYSRGSDVSPVLASSTLSTGIALSSPSEGTHDPSALGRILRRGRLASGLPLSRGGESAEACSKHLCAALRHRGWPDIEGEGLYRRMALLCRSAANASAESAGAVWLSGWSMKIAAPSRLQDDETSLDRDTGGQSVRISALCDVTRRLHRRSERRAGEPGRRRLRPAPRVDHESGWGLRPSGRPAGKLFDENEHYGAVLAAGRTVEQSITGAAIVTVSGSSCPVTGRRVLGGGLPVVTYVSEGSPARWRRRRPPPVTGTCWCLARTRRNGRSRPVCWNELQIHQIPVLFGVPSAVRGVAVSRRAGDRSG